ncbi:hypothetical protein HDV00_001501 [Rhizophlyctis rosea]|nr:hypothetical protein HDV00_001501 [Rhizophlyctis rosea]
MPPQSKYNLRSLSPHSETIVTRILNFLAKDIILRYDIPMYLALQQSINTTWAKETTRQLKEPLQRSQTILALHNPRFALKKPFLYRNPTYLATMTFSDVTALLTYAVKHHAQLKGFARLLLAYALKAKAESKPFGGPVYAFRSSDCVVRGDRYLEKFEDDGDDYALLEGIEHSGTNKNVIRYTFAVSKEDEEGEVTVIAIRGETNAETKVLRLTKARLVVENDKVVNQMINAAV